MSNPTDPSDPRYDEPIAGDPLIIAPVVSDDVVVPVEPIPTAPVEPAPPPTEEATQPDEGGSKVKAAALLAGAAALANKVRREAPKKLQEIREKRAAGRCVIVTEADGQMLAIGPFKDDDAARQELFNVGGAPRVVELMSESAFFESRTIRTAQ
jgi:hypothetical protein